MKKERPICHHCGQGPVRKHGFARSGLQRYLCTGCHRTFQTNYIYRGNEDDIARHIHRLLDEEYSVNDIAQLLQVAPKTISYHIALAEIDG